MNTPTVVPLMVWVAYVIWGYLCTALCQVAVVVCRHVANRWAGVCVQVATGVAVAVATVWYNNVFNSGDIRLYVLIGCIVGGLVYYLVCYDVVDRLLSRTE